VVNHRPRSDAGIVFALPIEAGRFADRAREARVFETDGLRLHEATVAGRSVAWVVAGPGVERASRAASLLIAGHRPRFVISAGFAGGLTPGIARGAVVTPRRAVRTGAEALELAACVAAAEGEGTTIVTVDGVVRSADEKRRLADASGADVVDLETWGIAREAAAAGLACGCVKVVSDAALDELPAEVVRLAEATSRWRQAGAALRSIGRRPAVAADLWKLWERAVIDSRSLADSLERTIATLPASG